MMRRIILDVPFSEKDEAKQLGARWDVVAKHWYIPDDLDPSPFHRWLPEPFVPNVRAEGYFIAETTRNCWKCGEPTKVYGFMLPPLHETLEPLDDDLNGFGPDDTFTEAEYQAWVASGASSEWQQQEPHCPATLAYITRLTDATVSRIRLLTNSYYLDFSKTTNTRYWMNHCIQCGMKQGDFELFEEPGKYFCVLRPKDAESITLYPINEAFQAECSVCAPMWPHRENGLTLLDLMTRNASLFE